MDRFDNGMVQNRNRVSLGETAIVVERNKYIASRGSSHGCLLYAEKMLVRSVLDSSHTFEAPIFCRIAKVSHRLKRRFRTRDFGSKRLRAVDPRSKHSIFRTLLVAWGAYPSLSPKEIDHSEGDDEH